MTEGEIVNYRWQDHLTSGKSGVRSFKRVHVKKAKFIKLHGPKSALLEFDTPAGPHRRAVPLANVFKIEGT